MRTSLSLRVVADQFATAASDGDESERSRLAKSIVSTVVALEEQSSVDLTPDQREIFLLHTEILLKYAQSGFLLSEGQSDALLNALVDARADELTFGDRVLRPDEHKSPPSVRWRSKEYAIVKSMIEGRGQLGELPLVEESFSGELLRVPKIPSRHHQGIFFPTDPRSILAWVNPYEDLDESFTELVAAIRSEGLLIDSRDVDALLTEWNDSLSLGVPRSSEVISRISSDIIVVFRDTMFRSPVTRNDLVTGLYTMQFQEGVGAGRAGPCLFDKVEEYLSGIVLTDPVEWAAARYRIAAGFSVAFTDAQFSPEILKRTYERMASIACNRGDAPTPRQFYIYAPPGSSISDVVAQSNALFLECHKIPLLRGDVSLPAELQSAQSELLFFTQYNAKTISPEMCATRQYRQFIRALPDMLKNGLRIERVNSCITKGIEGGLSDSMAVKLGLEIALGVYSSGEEKPWWFKEDFDFLCNYQMIDAQTAAILSEAALEAGYSYCRTVEAYQKWGWKLASVEGLDQSRVIAVCRALVTSTSPRYAEAYLSFAYTLLLEEEPNARQEVLQFFCSVVEEHGELDLIRAEISDERDPLSILPGILPILFFGLDRSTAQRVVDVGISLQDIREAVISIYARPLQDQLSLHPLIGGELTSGAFGYFSVSGLHPQVSLQPPERVGCNEDRPLSRIVSFWRQLKCECGSTTTLLADSYWCGVAASQVDPFRPTSGLLSAVMHIVTPRMTCAQSQDFNSIPSAIEYAEEDARRTQDGLASGLFALRQLGELHISGIIATSAIQEIFGWLAVDDDLTEVEESSSVLLECQRRVLMTTNGERRALSASQFDDFKKQQLIAAEVYFKGLQQISRHPLFLQVMQLVFAAYRCAQSSDSFRKEAEFLLSRCRLGVTNSPPNLALLAGRNVEAGAFQHPSAALAQHTSELSRLLIEPASREDLDRYLQQTDEVYLNARARFSRLELEGALEHLAEALERVYCGASSIEEFTIEYRLTIDQLNAALRFHWLREGFDFTQQIDHLLNEDFCISHFLKALPVLTHFDATEIAVLNQKKERPPQFSDVVPNAISLARTYAYSVWQLFETSRGKSADPSANLLTNTYGQSSVVELEAGWKYLTRLVTRDPEERARISQDCEVQELIAASFPLFQSLSRRWALEDCVYGPIGGRCHFNESANSVRVAWLGRFLQLDNTPFRLIHNSASLIFPGSSSSRAMRMYLLMLAAEGILDPRYPELQIGVPGRVDPSLCAVLGSAAILGTKVCAPFNADSFRSNQRHRSQTGARMVAYDAYDVSGGRNLALPFMAFGNPGDLRHGANVPGRTDVLGRWHVRWADDGEEPSITTLDDIDIVHAVGATLRQVMYGGPLSEVGREFIQRHSRILQDFGLLSVLKAEWVYIRERDAYTASDEENRRHFEEAVRPCMDAHFESADDFGRGKGIVFRIRENILWLRSEATKIRDGMLRDPRWRAHFDSLLNVQDRMH